MSGTALPPGLTVQTAICFDVTSVSHKFKPLASEVKYRQIRDGGCHGGILLFARR